MAKIKIEGELLQKLEKLAKVAGYSSTDEFIIHILEKEVAKIDVQEEDKDIIERLKGLGYIS